VPALSLYHYWRMKRTRELSRLFLTMLALAGALACSSEKVSDRTSAQPQTAAASPEPPETAPPSTPIPLQSNRVRGYRGTLPPVPTSPYAAATPEVIQAVYEFAARRPDVLRYVPCFCGCERNGHKGNEDCFVASRGADGRPTWDSHGLT